MLRSLRWRDGQSTGQLFREVSGSEPAPRRVPTDWTARPSSACSGGLTRAGLVRVVEDSFFKDGREHPLPARLSHHRGTPLPPGNAELAATLQLAQEQKAPAKKRDKRAKKAALPPVPSDAAPRRSKAAQAALPGAETLLGGAEPLPDLVEALKAWRRTEAQRRRVPAFRILTDRALDALASVRPRDEESLLAVRGIGPTVVQKYGRDILRILEAGT